MGSAERIVIELLMLFVGLLILFAPYLFPELFMKSTHMMIREDGKVPEEREVRLKWIFLNTLRGMWLYFAILGAFMLYDLYIVLSRLLYQFNPL
jgi:hypothetical protein